jgi:hypothetical protein
MKKNTKHRTQKSAIKTIFAIAFTAFVATQTFAQTELEPTLPALNFAPDARAAGMGDAGVATSADVNSQQWNAAKYAFAEENGGIGISYTPWLQAAISDIHITYLAGFYKFNNRESLSASLRFFSLGNIDFYNDNAEFMQSVKPSEYAIDLAYSRKLGKYVSGGVTFRYINSSRVASSNVAIERVSSFAADIAFYFQKPIELFSTNSTMAFGAAITNVGTKVKLGVSDTSARFLPMQLRLGARLTFNLDEQNSISPTIDVNKSLVPSSNEYAASSVLDAAVNGIADKWGRAVWAFGVEYSYNHSLFARVGYHLESQRLSGNSYLTFGAAWRYKNWDFAASYLFVTNSNNSILDNTYRISLAYYFKSAKKKSYYDYDL